MPYIIEVDPSEESALAYSFKDRSQLVSEVESIRSYLTEVTLSAVDEGGLEVDAASDLLRDISQGWVYNRNAEAFLQVASNLEDLSAARRRKLILGAAAGTLSTEYALRAVSNIEAWEDRRAEGTFEFVTKDGYEADVTPKGLKPHLVSGRQEIEDCFGADSLIAKTARQHGLDHCAAQLELTNRWGSTTVAFPDSPHMVLGRLDDAEQFEPVVAMVERP